MPLRQEESEARRAIIREWDDWARNNPADSNSAATGEKFVCGEKPIGQRIERNLKRYAILK